MPPKKILLLLDGDIICYQAASACELHINWNDDPYGEETYWFDPCEIVNYVTNYVNKHIDQFQADKVFICLSCNTEDNFRKQLFPEYKSNRKALRKPEGLVFIRDYIKEYYSKDVKELPTCEADDVMGIIGTDPDVTSKYAVVLVSIDKDMAQIPGVLWYNPRSDKSSKFNVAECSRFHLYQTITGDAVDNYKGAIGWGPVKTNNVLDLCTSLKYNLQETWEYIVRSCFNNNNTLALQNARCAKILNFRDWDNKNKRVRLWSPRKN